MKLGCATLALKLIAFAAFTAFAACADSDAVEGSAPPPDGGGGADTGAPPVVDDDAGSPEPDPPVDAGRKTCSDHGFCPTELAGKQTVEAIWGDGAGSIWAATTEGDLLRWEQDRVETSAWKVHASGLGPLHAVWGFGPTDVWVGGDNGIQHGTGTSSATLTFTASPLPPKAAPIASIWGLSATDLWAAGSMRDDETWEEVGRAYHFDGTQWSLDPISSKRIRFTHVWGSAGVGVWLAGLRNMIDTPWVQELIVVHKARDAADFVETTLPVDPDPEIRYDQKASTFTGAVVSSNTSMTLYGQAIPLFGRPSVWHGTSTDDGRTFTFTWSLDKRGSNPDILSVFGSAANDVWAAGEYGRLIHWNGTMWSTTAISITGLPVTDPLLSGWAPSSSEVWVGGKGMVLRFDPTKEKNGGVP